MRIYRGLKGKWAFRVGIILWLVFVVDHIPLLEGREIPNLDYVSLVSGLQDSDRSNFVFVSIDDEDFHSVFHGHHDPLSPKAMIDIVEKIASARPAVIAVGLESTDLKYRLLQERLPTDVPVVWAREATRAGEEPGAPFNCDEPVLPGVVLGGYKNPEPPFQAGISNLCRSEGVLRSYKWAFATMDGPPADSFSLAVLRVACSLLYANSSPKKCQMLQRCSPAVNCLEPALIRFSNGPIHPLSIRQLSTLSENYPDVLKEKIKGKIVFLGGEFQGSEILQTPLGPKYPISIHADALASALSGKMIWVCPRWKAILAELAAICSLFLLQHWIKRPAVRLSVVFAGTLAFSVCLSWIIFSRPIFFVSFMPVLGGTVLDAVKDLAEENGSPSGPLSASAELKSK